MRLTDYMPHAAVVICEELDPTGGPWEHDWETIKQAEELWYGDILEHKRREHAKNMLQRIVNENEAPIKVTENSNRRLPTVAEWDNLDYGIQWVQGVFFAQVRGSGETDYMHIFEAEQAYLGTEDLQRIAEDYFAAATRKRNYDSWSYIDDLVHFDIERRLPAGSLVTDRDERIINIHFEDFTFTIHAPHEDEPGQERFIIEPTEDAAEFMSEEKLDALTVEMNWDEPVRFFATLLEFIS